MAKQQGSDVQAPVAPVAKGPFYSFQYLDGEQKEFANKEDLDKGFRQSYLRRQEMERAMAEAQEIREKATQEVEEMKRQREQDRALTTEYLEWDRILRSNPAIYQQVEQLLRSQGGNVSYQAPQQEQPKSAVEERLEKFEQMLADMQQRSVSEAAMASLREKFPDFDSHKETISELATRLEKGDENTRSEILYQAARGYGQGAQDAGVQAGVNAARQAAPLVSSNGSAPAIESSVPEGASPDDARNTAYQELGIVPGQE